jgi:hypothetical protein
MVSYGQQEKIARRLAGFLENIIESSKPIPTIYMFQTIIGQSRHATKCKYLRSVSILKDNILTRLAAHRNDYIYLSP